MRSAEACAAESLQECSPASARLRFHVAGCDGPGLVIDTNRGNGASTNPSSTHTSPVPEPFLHITDFIFTEQSLCSLIIDGKTWDQRG